MINKHLQQKKNKKNRVINNLVLKNYKSQNITENHVVSARVDLVNARKSENFIDFENNSNSNFLAVKFNNEIKIDCNVF